MLTRGKQIISSFVPLEEHAHKHHQVRKMIVVKIVRVALLTREPAACRGVKQKSPPLHAHTCTLLPSTEVCNVEVLKSADALLPQHNSLFVLRRNRTSSSLPTLQSCMFYVKLFGSITNHRSAQLSLCTQHPRIH